MIDFGMTLGISVVGNEMLRNYRLIRCIYHTHQGGEHSSPLFHVAVLKRDRFSRRNRSQGYKVTEGGHVRGSNGRTQKDSGGDVQDLRQR